MKIPIVPGTLCWLRTTDPQENYGKILTVTRKGMPVADGAQVWWGISNVRR